MSNPDQSTFEERLLVQLRAAVAERGAEAAVPGVPAWRRGGPRLAIAGTAVAAIAAGALIVSAGGGDTPAAYAVEAAPDGQVSVEIRSLSDAAGLEEALGEAGIPARVDYLATGMACREPRFQPVTAPAPGDGGKVTSSVGQGAGGASTFSISRNAVGPGQTLVLTASPGPGGKGESLSMAVAEGEVGACQPVQAPAGAPPTQAGASQPPSETGPSTRRSGAPGAGAGEKGTTARTG